jgi:mono/diheme cytochrome c family protein
VSFIASRLEAETRPLGPSSVMPPFGKLLSEAERNAIAKYIGTLPK